MVKKLHFCRCCLLIILTVVTTGLFAFSPAVQGKPSQVDCPLPSVPRGQQCVLKGDAVLSETLVVESDTKFNCQGHKITPLAEGALGNPNSRSQPELAIFLNDVTNVQIQNCIVEGFDHGILAINSKLSEGQISDPRTRAQLKNKILDNTITSRFVPVHLVLSDNFAIKGNSLTWLTRGGAGVYIHNHSVRNEVIDNTVAGDFASTTQGAVIFPGPTATGVPPSPVANQTTLNSNPIFTGVHGAIIAVQVLDPMPLLFNAVIGGEVFQFEDTLKGNEFLDPDDEGVTADTLVEGNHILFLQENKLEAGGVFSNSLRTTVRNNIFGRSSLDPDGPDGGRFSSARAGGIRPILPAGGEQFPGTCSLDANRLCLSQFDCEIPGVDVASLGTCSNLPAQVYPTWYTQDFLVEYNTIYSPFQVAVGTDANHPTIRGNRIIGPQWIANPMANFAAIVLSGSFSVETGVVTNNTAENCAVPLLLVRTFQGLTAAFFGSEISRNDFTGYTTAISTSNDFDIPAHLSGNYWDMTCEDGGFDPHKVLKVNGAVNPNITDLHPYGEPVADTPEEELPEACF